MKIQPSKKCYALIRSFEGFVPHRYKCSGGKTTIGYGHVIRNGESIPGTITEEYGRKLLSGDVVEVSQQVIESLEGKCAVNQHQFDALVSWTLNLGIGRLRRSTLLKLVRESNHEAAEKEFLKWIYSDGKVEVGLMVRRKIEALLYAGKLGYLAIDKVPEYVEEERKKMKMEGMK